MSETLDLTYLIKNMNPTLMEGEYVFCKVNTDSKKVHELEPVSTFKNGKEYIVIITKENADKNKFGYSDIYKMVSLEIQSNKSEAEFLAVITGVFADQGILSKLFTLLDVCYLFVPVEKIKDAQQLLHDLTVDF
jgi:hypothetical protein